MDDGGASDFGPDGLRVLGHTGSEIGPLGPGNGCTGITNPQMQVWTGLGGSRGCPKRVTLGHLLECLEIGGIPPLAQTHDGTQFPIRLLTVFICIT